MTDRPFRTHREAALALLSGRHRLSRKAGQFLGQIAVDPSPLSDAQAGWLAKLLERASLPPLATGGAKLAPTRTRPAIGTWKRPLPLPAPWQRP